ncbi:putative membrane protein, partial [Chlamydia psittaci 06-1683]
LFCWILFPVARLVFILHPHSSSPVLSSLYPHSSFCCLCSPLCFSLFPVFSLVFLLTALEEREQDPAV